MKAPKFITGGTPEDITFKKKDPGATANVGEIQLFKTQANLIPAALKTPRKLVIVEVPFSVEDPALMTRYLNYSKKCIKDSFNRTEAPFLSHILYSGSLNFKVQNEKEIGFVSHASWLVVADLIAVYIDYGITPEMQVAINIAKIRSKKVEYRSIGLVA